MPIKTVYNFVSYYYGVESSLRIKFPAIVENKKNVETYFDTICIFGYYL